MRSVAFLIESSTPLHWYWLDQPICHCTVAAPGQPEIGRSRSARAACSQLSQPGRRRASRPYSNLAAPAPAPAPAAAAPATCCCSRTNSSIRHRPPACPGGRSPPPCVLQPRSGSLPTASRWQRRSSNDRLAAPDVFTHSTHHAVSVSL